MYDEYGPNPTATPALPVEWGTVKRRILAACDGKRDSCVEHHRSHDEWSGGTWDQTRDWIRNGYHDDSFALAVEMAEQAQDSRVFWNDETGIPDANRLYGGYDDFWFGPTTIESKPALTVNCEFYFSRGFKHEDITGYGAWLARLFTGLENAGYNLAVNVYAGINCRTKDGSYHGEKPHHMLMTVKEFSERSDFTEWSALFAPTGYRHTIFAAIRIAADENGKVARGSLGGPFSRRAKVTLEDNVLTIAPGNVRWDEEHVQGLLNETGLL